jgi:hypothetical protein
MTLAPFLRRSIALGLPALLGIVASCGTSDPRAAPPPPTSQIGTTSEPATFASTVLTGGVLVATPVPLPGTPTCIHPRPDGTCITPTSTDADADGFVVGRDCNDHDPYTYPGAQEIPCDNVDEDCDGVDFCPPDADHDGFSPPSDCDDRNPKRNPRATEIFCNGIDEDCNGYDDCDADADGESVPGDCNDHDATISPHAREVMCDGIDQNCDSTDCCNNDQDGDGAPCQNDCDDHDSRAYPGAPVPDGCFWKDLNCDGIPDGVCR